MDIIGLDIDGVLCNTNIVLERLLADEFGITPDWTTVKQYKLEHMDFVTKEALARFYEYMDSGELYDGVQPHNYAEHATKKLRNEGFRIALITSRSSKLRGLTEDWLKEHDIAYDTISFIESSRKHEVVSNLDAKAFVEDRFDVLESIVNEYKPLDLGLYVIDYSYNTQFNNEYIIRNIDVAEAVDKIVNFRRWRGFLLNKCQGDIEKFIKEYQDGKNIV